MINNSREGGTKEGVICSFFFLSFFFLSCLGGKNSCRRWFWCWILEGQDYLPGSTGGKKKTEESPGSEPRRAQFVRNTKSVGVKQRGHGAEGRRAEGASWFGFLVQPCLGSCIPALWNHQKWSKCLNQCPKVCEKKAERSPTAVKIVQVEIMRTRTKVMMVGKERRGWIWESFRRKNWLPSWWKMGEE